MTSNTSKVGWMTLLSGWNWMDNVSEWCLPPRWATCSLLCTSHVPNDDDYDDDDNKNILFLWVPWQWGWGLWGVHRASASVFLFRDMKISFGAFASTDSYVDLFSMPENTPHKDAPARFHLAPKWHLLVCSTAFAILPVDVLLAAKKSTLCHAATGKPTYVGR